MRTKGEQILDKLNDIKRKTPKIMSWFNWVVKSDDEQKATIYKDAANAFKYDNDLKMAGENYIKAAKEYLNIGDDYESQQQYIAAANCFKQTDPKKAIEILEDVVHRYVSEGRFQSAVKKVVEAAEICESMMLKEKACSLYEKASNWYKADGMPSMATSAIKKHAMLTASLGNYQKASELFNEIIELNINSDLGQYTVREYIFKYLICLILIDQAESVTRLIDEYVKRCPKFASSAEHETITKLANGVLKNDKEMLDDVIQNMEYAVISDRWTQEMVNIISSKIGSHPSIL